HYSSGQQFPALLPVVVGVVDDFLHVVAALVVGEQGLPEPVRLLQVPTHRTQVAGGCHGRVVDVVRVGDAVTVGVHTPLAPALRDDLERAAGPVPLLVAVQLSPVGVLDALHPGTAVQRRADHRAVRPAGLAQLRPAVPAVAGLHRPDAGQHGPGQVALGHGLLERALGVAVGL